MTIPWSMLTVKYCKSKQYINLKKTKNKQKKTSVDKIDPDNM